MYEGAGLGPEDVDIFNPYDGYAPMTQFFLEAFQWHGVKRGDAFAFYAGDIRVEGPHPLCSSGGNLGNGRTRTAMYTDCIEQLRGTAGARQVKVRAETALGAFTTPSSGGWTTAMPLMAQFFLEAFQWHGVKRGDAFALYAGDIRVEGPHPFCFERRQSGERAHPYGHVHRQHRAAPRHGWRTAGQGSGRDCAGGIHHAKQWRLDHVRQIPELTAS